MTEEGKRKVREKNKREGGREVSEERERNE